MATLEKSKEDLDNFRANLDEKTASTVIESLIKIMVTGLIDDEALAAGWKNAYTTFYAPQILILSKLLSTTLKYSNVQNWCKNLEYGVRKYDEGMEKVYKEMWKVKAPSSSINRSAESKKMMSILDGYLQGSFQVCDACAKEVMKIEQFLSKDKPRDVFDLDFGVGATTMRRNDLCSALQKLVGQTDRVRELRNFWAGKFGMVPVFPDYKKKISKQCAEFPM